MSWNYLPFGHLAGHNIVLAEFFALLTAAAVLGLLLGLIGLLVRSSRLAYYGAMVNVVGALIALYFWKSFLNQGPTNSAQAVFQHAELLLFYRNLLLGVALAAVVMALVLIHMMITENGRYGGPGRRGFDWVELAWDLGITVVLIAIAAASVIGALSFSY